MSYRLIAPVILLALLLSAGCTLPSGSTTVPPVQTGILAGSPTIPSGPPAITIRATPDRYIPLMSSTVGIRLEPVRSATTPVVYTWSTNYGYFVSWNETDYRVTVLNASARTTEPSIYWSYPPNDMGVGKPPVTIRLTVEAPVGTGGSSEGRETVATGEIRIGWEGNDTAVVLTQAGIPVQRH
jgi:hypothetical protein